MERRAARRKIARLACMLHACTGETWYGRTCDLSFDGALIECPAAGWSRQTGPRENDMGMFVFSVSATSREECLRIGCRIVRVCGAAIALQLLTSALPREQKEKLANFLDA